jgi:hypothetical protein
VKEKGGKPDGKAYPLPYGLRNLYEISSMGTPKILQRKLIDIVSS